MTPFRVVFRISMIVAVGASAAPLAAQQMCSPNALFGAGNKMGMALADIYRAPTDNARPSYLREAQSKLMSAKTSLKRAGITTQDRALDSAISAVATAAAKVGPANLITPASAGALAKDVERALGPVRSEVGRVCPK
ncbi:MAG: hypothetical protein Q7J32_15690 [Sphingomonadaceae bacterium]|nr:hypothetical protein [Sphingomonadaceae bacterium]